ncbi:lactate dehydrogenase [Roseivivax halodurans JCM 10272]|uniref:Lactate dehydrogenase n=1 Tax=Roseivivax halodurans JCM 10272 TaxID=1449350 RepID=X7EKA7_9RHOB|nr:2-hydroxyacid dehydrogenase [Roseivivax halodurans]ETX15606.1 lactate dehydrogenase [Roseivivax halodurans JCM 10272]
MTDVAAIGNFKDHERAELTAAFDPIHLTRLAELQDVDPGTREGLRAIAYKGHVPFGAAEMDLVPSLGLIANYGVGFDAIDIGEAQARGIRVTNTPDVLNDDVADLAIGLWLMQRREMEAASRWARDGHWAEKGEFRLVTQASCGTAGILGLGRIGREIADRLAAFKMEIHYTSRTEKETPGWTFHEDPVALARAVDTLFVALVGGPETENAVSKDVIEALGPTGVLVNISRGSTVDEAALLDALEDGRLGGAGLDVFRGEPAIDPRFYEIPSVVIQPHQGSGSVATRAAMAKLQRDNVAAFLQGDDLLTPVV